MSPRYKEVDIPAARADEFEAITTSLGGSIGSKTPLPEEAQSDQQAEWLKQVALAREKVAAMQNSQGDIEVARAIRTGVRRCIGQVFKNPVYANRKKAPSLDTWSKVKERMTDLFKCLPETIPDSVRVTYNETGVTFASKSGPELLPTQIAISIDFYGLNGQPVMAKSEIAEVYGVSLQTVNKAINSVNTALRRDSQIAGLVLDTPPQGSLHYLRPSPID